MNKTKQVFTVPNILSLVRLLLIPWIVWLYIGRQDPRGALLVLLLSGLTDVVDGYIARKYDLVTDLGKILDPVADKLTQAATLGCLITRFPCMLLILGILVAKELFGGIMGLCAIRRSGQVLGADWHGKTTTVLLYAVMAVHMLLPDISQGASVVLMLMCAVMMLVSWVLYWMRNWRQIRGAKHV